MANVKIPNRQERPFRRAGVTFGARSPAFASRRGRHSRLHMSEPREYQQAHVFRVIFALEIRRSARRTGAPERSRWLLWHIRRWRRKFVADTGTRRDRQRGDQAGMAVAKAEFPAMKRRDRRSQTQAQAGSGQRTACLEPDESLDRVFTIAFRYARAMVGDAEQHLATHAPCLDHDILGDGACAERL